MKKFPFGPFSAERQLAPANDESLQDQDKPQSFPRDSFGGQAEILHAIDELRRELFSGSKYTVEAPRPAEKPVTQNTASLIDFHQRQEAVALKAEIAKLSKAIETTKREIAALRYRDKKYERIADVTSELDEVISDTEIATETILTCCEELDQHILELPVNSSEERAEISAMSEKVTRIFEACNFQDITGQRITKVVNALKFIEERVEVMTGILGGNDAYAGMAPQDRQAAPGDKLLLNGPARSTEESATQAEIDSLFDDGVSAERDQTPE